MRLAALLTAIGLTASGGEAKRKLAEGAVRLEGETVSDPAQLVLPEVGQTLRLSLGKKRHALVTR
jgi:tyrosyl-tRNA synthetase